jgi:glycosyltransferase involved in cell wall biosynthesis
MKKQLKVFHLLANFRWTGPAEGVVGLCRDLIKAGHQVRLFTTPHPSRLLADKAAERAVIPSEDLWLARKHPLLTGWDILRLKRILEKEKPDILHLHLSGDHWIGALAARWAAGPTRVVRTIHHPRTIPRRMFQTWLYEKGTDAFITLSKADRDRMLEIYSISPERVSVIHGAVDTDRFHPDYDPRPVRAEFGIKPGAPVIGLVARFQPHRGHEGLISSVPELRKHLPAVRVILVGRGEHRPAMEQLVKRLGLEHHVLFAGYRDRDLPQVYGAMDVKVFLESGSDTSCRAVLEAMACGLPVVAHPVGALPDTVVNGVTGYLVPRGDTARLIKRLIELLEDRVSARKMGDAGRSRIEEDFSEAARREKTEAFYDSILSRSSG